MLPVIIGHFTKASNLHEIQTTLHAKCYAGLTDHRN